MKKEIINDKAEVETSTKKEIRTLTKEEQIAEWKKEWGKIYKTGVDNTTFIWRKLKRKEYSEIMAETPESISVEELLYHRQEKIAKAIVLYPNNIEELLKENCGLATTIADTAMLKSGFIVTTETEEL